MIPVITTTNNQTGEVKNYVFKKKPAKPKTYGIKEGHYFYAVVGKKMNLKVVECKITLLSTSRGPLDPPRVRYKDMKTGTVYETRMFYNRMNTTKKAAHRQLIAKLRQELRHESSYKLRRIREITKMQNLLAKAIKAKAKLK